MSSVARPINGLAVLPCFGFPKTTRQLKFRVGVRILRAWECVFVVRGRSIRPCETTRLFTTKMYCKKEHAFATTKKSDYDSLESQISVALWKCRFSDVADRDKVIEDSRLACLLEYWMPFSEIEYTRNLGTWCDGIPLLTVADINRTAFAVAGVGYFPDDLSLFEVNFYYKRRRDLHADRIEFRFGLLDGSGRLLTISPKKDPAHILKQRARDDRHWAVEVDLIPRGSLLLV